MSHLITDISQLKNHYQENQLVKVRVFGTILDFNPSNKFILIKSNSLLSNDNSTIKLILQEDIKLNNNPQLAYSGTMCDCYGLYNGENILLLSIRVITDANIFLEHKEIFDKISSI